MCFFKKRKQRKEAEKLAREKAEQERLEKERLEKEEAEKQAKAKQKKTASKEKKETKKEEKTEVVENAPQETSEQKETETEEEVAEKKARKAVYRVVFDKEDSLWKIKKDGAKRIIASYKTKQEALEKVQSLSKNQELNFVVMKKDGKFQKKANLKLKSDKKESN